MFLLSALAALATLVTAQSVGLWTPTPTLGTFDYTNNGLFRVTGSQVEFSLSFGYTIPAGDAGLLIIPVPIGIVGPVPEAPGNEFRVHASGDCVAYIDGLPIKASVTVWSFTSCDNRTGMDPAGSDILRISVVNGGASGDPLHCHLQGVYKNVFGQTCA